jgi:hypothetical protein
MPAKSGKQYRFMQMMAHSPEKSRKDGVDTGPSKAVAKEFIDKTPESKRKKWAKRDNPGHSY